jgi:hypothetical protein
MLLGVQVFRALLRVGHGVRKAEVGFDSQVGESILPSISVIEIDHIAIMENVFEEVANVMIVMIGVIGVSAAVDIGVPIY